MDWCLFRLGPEWPLVDALEQLPLEEEAAEICVLCPFWLGQI
jgi:hypothetical protein